MIDIAIVAGATVEPADTAGAGNDTDACNVAGNAVAPPSTTGACGTSDIANVVGLAVDDEPPVAEGATIASEMRIVVGAGEAEAATVDAGNENVVANVAGDTLAPAPTVGASTVNAKAITAGEASAPRWQPDPVASTSSRAPLAPRSSPRTLLGPAG